MRYIVYLTCFIGLVTGAIDEAQVGEKKKPDTQGWGWFGWGSGKDPAAIMKTNPTPVSTKKSNFRVPESPEAEFEFEFVEHEFIGDGKHPIISKATAMELIETPFEDFEEIRSGAIQAAKESQAGDASISQQANNGHEEAVVARANTWKPYLSKVEEVEEPGILKGDELKPKIEDEVDEPVIIEADDSKPTIEANFDEPVKIEDVELKPTIEDEVDEPVEIEDDDLKPSIEVDEPFIIKIDQLNPPIEDEEPVEIEGDELKPTIEDEVEGMPDIDETVEEPVGAIPQLDEIHEDQQEKKSPFWIFQIKPTSQISPETKVKYTRPHLFFTDKLVAVRNPTAQGVEPLATPYDVDTMSLADFLKTPSTSIEPPKLLPFGHAGMIQLFKNSKDLSNDDSSSKKPRRPSSLFSDLFGFRGKKSRPRLYPYQLGTHEGPTKFLQSKGPHSNLRQ